MTELSYPHPAALDGEPEAVARAAVDTLAEATDTYGAHVLAVVQQVRSGYMTGVLREEPNLTSAELADRWDESPEAVACIALMRAVRVTKQATMRLQSG